MLLGVGTNAWAEDVYTTVYQRNVTYGNANIWKEADITAWGGNANLSIDVPTDETADTYYGLKGSADASYSGSITLATTSYAKVKYELTVYTSRTYQDGNLHYIQFGDKVRISWVCHWASGEDIYISTDGTSSISNTKLDDVSGGSPGRHTVSIIFNTALNTVESFSIDDTDCSSFLSKIIAEPGNLSKITMGYARSTKSYSSNWGLSTITVSECPQSVTEKDYTINYTYGGSTITSQGGKSTVGATVLATLNSMWNEGNTTKYFVADNATTSFEITSDGTNVFEVPLRLAETINYTVKAVDGEGDELAIDNLASGSVVEGETQMVYWSKYIKIGNQWYETASPYGKNITTASNTVTYTPSTITYFVEGENMNGYNAAGTSTSTSYSGGITGRMSANSNWYTAAVDVTGLYTVSFPYALIANSSASTLGGLYVRASDGTTTLIEENVSLSSNSTYTKTNVAIPAGSSFLISKGSNNSNYGIDYVTLTLTAVSATLGTNGYSTFASSYPLDLTTANLPDGLTAYKAAVSGTTVTFSPLNQTVPANTGILLQGEAGETYNIPVASSSTAVTENAFLVNTAGTVFNAEDADENSYYFGLIKNTLTFGVFDPATVAIPANKAYLKVLKSSIDDSPSRALKVVFGDETTGIKTVNGEGFMVNGIHNLNGQRVNQPTKGLYIVNGKKVIIK